MSWREWNMIEGWGETRCETWCQRDFMLESTSRDANSIIHLNLCFLFSWTGRKKLADKKLCKCFTIWRSKSRLRCINDVTVKWLLHYCEAFIRNWDFTISTRLCLQPSRWINFLGKARKNHDVELSNSRIHIRQKFAITIFKWSQLIFHGRNSLARSWILYFPLCGRQRVDRSAIIIKILCCNLTHSQLHFFRSTAGRAAIMSMKMELIYHAFP